MRIFYAVKLYGNARCKKYKRNILLRVGLLDGSQDSPFTTVAAVCVTQLQFQAGTDMLPS
jgi:hypothetical protein